MARQVQANVSLKTQMDALIARANERVDAFLKEVIQDLNQAVVEATGPSSGIRVVTGFLRGSWYASIGSLPDGAGPPDPSGAGSVARMNLVAQEMRVGSGPYYAVNGASYAGYVHWGTSKMAARPWVAQTLARAPEIAEAALAKVLAAR